MLGSGLARPRSCSALPSLARAKRPCSFPCHSTCVAATLVVLSLASVLSGCAAANSAPSSPGTSTAQPPSARPANELLFSGMCDASGAVALSARSMLVADDEDNVLRVFDVERGGAPTAQLELSELLGLPRKEKKDGSLGAPPEVDIEAAARIGDRAYFITSHGRNSAGKLRQERLRFFATSAPAHGELALIGGPYAELLKDLLAEPRLAPFELAAASLLAPKAEGGLNIEGLTARAQGGLWLGFRNPIPKGRALLVPLLNPDELVTGKPAELGEPVTLDLGGRGVRGLSSWHGRYLIAAGSFDATRAAAIFAWDGGDQVTAVTVPELGRYNPEALFTPDGRDEVLLLSDDGSVPISGVECKRLKDPTRKQFRGLWFRPQ